MVSLVRLEKEIIDEEEETETGSQTRVQVFSLKRSVQFVEVMILDLEDWLPQLAKERMKEQLRGI